jgi:hypothetical protein
MPQYMNQLELTSFSDGNIAMMTQMSFYIMCFALLTGAMIILVNMFKARSAESALERAQAQA